MVELRAMTAQELLRHNHEPFRSELICGRLVEMEPAGALHGLVAAQICRLPGLGPEDHAEPMGQDVVGKFQLASDPDTVRAPDASFVALERVQATGIPSGYWPGAPDVAFEVSSPGDRRGEIEAKTRAWIEAGTRAVVVVDPRRRNATIHGRGGATPPVAGAQRLDLDDVLPGFAPVVDDLFA